VTGAGPILHGIFDHLHTTRGTSWYRTPPQIVERIIHPLTGRLLPNGDPRGVQERFIADNLAPDESPGDYDADGRVQLPPEYGDWLASAENCVRDEATGASNGPQLRITSPLAGAKYVVDPDVQTSDRIPLRALGGKQLIWESDSLRCGEQDGHHYAFAVQGEHRITVTDVETGRCAEIRISVHTL
jgi:penicillin-binding protein 1C